MHASQVQGRPARQQGGAFENIPAQRQSFGKACTQRGRTVLTVVADWGLRYTMTSMNVPDPVMSLAVTPKTREGASGFSKALYRFQREDPTFRVPVPCCLVPAVLTSYARGLTIGRALLSWCMSLPAAKSLGQ